MCTTSCGKNVAFDKFFAYRVSFCAVLLLQEQGVESPNSSSVPVDRRVVTERRRYRTLACLGAAEMGNRGFLLVNAVP